MKHLAFLTLIATGSFAAMDKCPKPPLDSCKCPHATPSLPLCAIVPEHQWNGAAELSFLAWQAREDGLAFAVKNNPDNPAADVDVNGTLLAPHFAWAPAMKLDFDVGFTNTWDLDLRWTTFYSKSTNSAHAQTNSTTGSGLFPIWLLPSAYLSEEPMLYGKAYGVWQVHLNTVDIELGIEPRLTPKLNFRLHGGLKAVSIFQHFSATYSNGLTTGGVTPLQSRGSAKLKYKAAGPRIGFETSWKLNKGWSILANCAGAIALGQFDFDRKDSDKASESSTTHDQESKFHESVYNLRPIFEMLMGFGWDTTYGKRDQCAFALQLAYEVQYYWAQNLMTTLASQQMSFDAFQSRSDLHFHGITLNFRFGF